VLGLTTAGGASAATIVVSEASLSAGWNADVNSGGTTAFVNADSLLNGGALQLDTDSTTASRASLSTTLHQGTLLSSVTELAYSTKQVAASFAGGDASYQLSIDLDGSAATTTDRTTLIYEPYWQDPVTPLGDPAPVVPGAWQDWDVDAGVFWSSQTAGGFTAGSGGEPFYTLAQAKAIAGASATVTVIGTGVGTYNTDYTILVDGLTFNGTTYDFQPRVFTKDDCKDGGWATNFTEEFVNQGDCVSFFASNGKTHS
jgi:hypothetical protein